MKIKILILLAMVAMASCKKEEIVKPFRNPVKIIRSRPDIIKPERIASNITLKLISFG
jgi:hypothetical protein